MIDNKLLQVALISSCVLLVIAIAMTWADITRYGGADQGAGARAVPAAQSAPAEGAPSGQ